MNVVNFKIPTKQAVIYVHWIEKKISYPEDFQLCHMSLPPQKNPTYLNDSVFETPRITLFFEFSI